MITQISPIPNARRIDIDEGLVPVVVRYALPRRSYLTSWVLDEMWRIWPDLSEKARVQIRTDIAHAIRDHECFGLHPDLDLDPWRQFLDIATPVTVGSEQRSTDERLR